jgi:hypothetical protein
MRYGEDLDCLHEDLEFVLVDLEVSQEQSYSDRLFSVDASMYFKRLALIYHTENVDLRLYAYREKVFKLVRHFYGLKDISERDLRLKDRVLTWLRENAIEKVASTLTGLRDDVNVSAALNRRRLFTHGLAERDDFRSLTSTARIDDVLAGLGTIDKAQRYMDLDAAYRDRWSAIDTVCQSLAQFRFDLVEHLTATAPRRA